ncbi:MAG: hypothetical protein RUDDFDWM_000212 [Candidatus Fervidibacterota bacterium]
MGRSRGVRRKSAIDYCMRLLSRRQYSSRELEVKLQKRGYSEQTIARTIARLKEIGLVNDYSLAADIVRSAIERRNKGRYALIAEMKRLMLPEECIQGAISAFDEFEEAKIATELLRKWLGKRNLPSETDGATNEEIKKLKRRMMERLLMRGFSVKAIALAFNHIGWRFFESSEWIHERSPSQAFTRDEPT